MSMRHPFIRCVFGRWFRWAREKCKIRSFPVAPRPNFFWPISFFSTFSRFVEKGSNKIREMWYWHVGYIILSASDPFRTLQFVRLRCYLQSFETGLGLVAPPAIYRLFCKFWIWLFITPLALHYSIVPSIYSSILGNSRSKTMWKWWMIDIFAKKKSHICLFTTTNGSINRCERCHSQARTSNSNRLATQQVKKSCPVFLRLQI